MKILLLITPLAIAFILGWLFMAIKAAKDPDVIAASDLRMSVTRYRLYRALFEELQSVYK